MGGIPSHCSSGAGTRRYTDRPARRRPLHPPAGSRCHRGRPVRGPAATGPGLTGLETGPPRTGAARGTSRPSLALRARIAAHADATAVGMAAGTGGQATSGTHRRARRPDGRPAGETPAATSTGWKPVPYKDGCHGEANRPAESRCHTEGSATSPPGAAVPQVIGARGDSRTSVVTGARRDSRTSVEGILAAASKTAFGSEPRA